jgi:hypothetical protein
MITPDPKYFVIKKANGGTLMRFVRAAAMGSNAPKGTNQLTQSMTFKASIACCRHTTKRSKSDHKD